MIPFLAVLAAHDKTKHDHPNQNQKDAAHPQ
jgi:hypothetical protein